MTDREIKIKCALACGFTWVGNKNDGYSLTSELGEGPQERGGYLAAYWDAYVPKYLRDQNACEDFRRVLDSEKYSIPYSSNANDHKIFSYIGNLVKLTADKDYGFKNGTLCFSSVCALLKTTPRQKCEAFLRAIGEWEEEVINNGYEGE